MSHLTYPNILPHVAFCLPPRSDGNVTGRHPDVKPLPLLLPSSESGCRGNRGSNGH